MSKSEEEKAAVLEKAVKNIVHWASSLVTRKKQLLGGLSSKYSTGPLFHNSELQISSGLSTFLELRSAGSEADAK